MKYLKIILLFLIIPIASKCQSYPESVKKYPHHLAAAFLMDEWISNLPKTIQFSDHYGFLRQTVRKFKNGSQLNYLWNMSDQWQKVALTARANVKFEDYYWLNPSDGFIIENNKDKLSHNIPPYSSIILYASMKSVPDSVLSVSKPSLEYKKYLKAKEVSRISRWDISTGNVSVKDSPLFDWRNKKALKFKSEEGVYTGSFKLDKIKQGKYFLDLGKVYFTAEVFINGKYVAKRIGSPYGSEIITFCTQGKTKLEYVLLQRY